MALNIDEQARKEANLRLLQRSMDRSISNILGSATHVVLYSFSQSSQSWEKSNVEGSLFLAVRPAGYLLVILNRNSPDNYPIALSQDFQLQHQDPYLILRQKEKDETVIRGIWFPSPNERVAMNDLLTQVLDSFAAAKAASTSVDQGAAIAALLSPMTLAEEEQTKNISSSSSNNARPAAEASPSSASQQQQPTLDKKSLQLALLSLIQDDRFLDLLHAQYLKVAHARSSRNGNGSS